MMTFSVPRRVVWGFFLATMLLLGGCAVGGPQEARPRFFWPPPPNQPRIEFIDFYQVEDHLKRGKSDWFEEYVLGRQRPKSILQSPAGVASDGKGRVLVTDLKVRKAYVFDFVKGEVRSLQAPNGDEMLMMSPLGICVDDAGQAYVADARANKIYVYGVDEKLKAVIGSESLKHPTGVAVDTKRGRIYVTDTWAHQVLVYSLSGEELLRIGERGANSGRFNFPVDLDLDEEGNLYILDSMNARVQVLTPEGEFLRMFGERGTALGSFQVPKSIAVSPSGHVYVTDGLAHKLVVFNTQGEFLLALGGREVFSDGIVHPGGFYMPRGVSVDRNDAIWVADSLNNMFHQFQYLNEQYLAEHPILEEQVFQR